MRRLEKLTGQSNLAHGTLLRLRENLCRNQTGAIAERRRWCPKCYSTQSPHIPEPLVWLMPLITRCPVHDVPLDDACTYCGASQLPWRTDDARRYCHKCRRPLTACRSLDARPTAWQTWCQIEMLRIVEHIASPDSSEFCTGAMRTFFTSLPPPKSGVCGPTAHGRLIRQVRDDLSKKPDLLPRLKTIFQVAASWGTTPLDIFLRPKEAASPVMFDGDPLIPRTPPKRPFKKQNYSRCDKRMRALVDLPEEILLPPATHICSECAVSPSNFQESHRETWNTYMVEKTRRLKQHKEREVILANTYMDKLITRLRHSGKRLHRRNAIAQMIRDIHVPQTVARSALRLSLARLRMERDDNRTERSLSKDPRAVSM